MTGNTLGRSKLEGILNSVSENDTNYRHRLMQVSLSAYLLETVGFDKGYGEYWLTVDSRMKKNRSREAKWPADIVLSYYENGRKIIEIIEVETRAIERYGGRFNNLKQKEKRADDAVYFAYLNKVMRDADEVRFSVALNASCITDDKDFHQQVRNFVRTFDSFGKKVNIKEHNMYLLRKNLAEFMPNNRHRDKECIKADLTRGLDSMYSNGISSIYTAISWEKARSY